jgi:hypothetical protein
MGVICFHHKAFSGPWPAKVLQGLTIRQQHSDCGVFVCWGARIIFSGQAIPLIEDGGLITHSTRIGGVGEVGVDRVVLLLMVLHHQV